MKPKPKRIGRPPGGKNRPSVQIGPPEWALCRRIAELLGPPWAPGYVASAALRWGLENIAERHGILVNIEVLAEMKPRGERGDGGEA